MPIYTYTNGSTTSTTTVVNGTTYTQNVTMIGSNSSCSSTQTCSEGYSLYIPCVKNIVPGQNVCFEFYVADNANQDVADLRDIDALTLSLSGRYGCKYGDYKYPDNIEFLQSYNTETIFSDDFNDKNRIVCYLSVNSFNIDGTEMPEGTVKGVYGSFYNNDNIELVAYDTPSHIFMGWIDLDSEESEGESEFFSTENELSFEIVKDTHLAAIYRPRKKYLIIVHPFSGHTRYNVTLDGKQYDMYLKSGIDANSNLYGDAVEIIEGYHFVATCIPISTYRGNYMFKKWSSGETETSIELIAGDDLVCNICKHKLGDNIIALWGEVDKCENDDDYVRVVPDKTPSKLEFETGKLIEHSVENKIIVSETPYTYDTSDYSYMDNVFLASEKYNNYLKLNDGVLVIKGKNSSDIVVVTFYAKSNGLPCGLCVTVGGIEKTMVIDNNSFEKISLEFEGISENSDVKINSFAPLEGSNECFIENISIEGVSDIVNKGKARICFDSEDTVKFHTGLLTATGAISSNGSIYGIPCTLLGNVSGKKISIQ